MAVAAFAMAAGLACSAHAQQQVVDSKIFVSPSGGSLEIAEWTDNLLRHKYSVINSAEGNSGQRWWFAQNGSANRGANEAGRSTSRQEWCRVRYIYGDNVRIPECWGEFMYSSHLITGIDGMHYELWFSPSSLSYFKIRNQETGLWYAHDGSANDGRQRTTKDDWCRIIFYHMHGIVKMPQECSEAQAKIVNAIAGTSGEAAKATELLRLRRMMGLVGLDQTAAVLKNAPSSAAGSASGPAQAAKTVAGESGVTMGETGFDKMASGRLAYDKMNYVRNGGLKVMSSTSAGAQVLQAGVGVGVGVGVSYGVDAIKNYAGWKAKDANAGQIAAEVITTTVASSALTTAIMTVAGATFNPVAAGVGLVIAGAVAGGEEIKKASDDTGIRFESGFDSHPRYMRDLNGIHSTVFAPRISPGTYLYEECASEGGRCEFGGYRTVRYGAGEAWEYKTFLGSADCGVAAFGRDPAPNVVKRCEAPVYLGEGLSFVDCAGQGERCDFAGTRTVAYGANQSWFEKEVANGTDCSHTVFGDPAPGVAKRCAVFLNRNEVPQWVVCASEGQLCLAPGTRTVRYGAGGAWVQKTASDSLMCDYRQLGDPRPGVSKSCEVRFTAGELRKWQDCAGEGQQCKFVGVRVVRYGANGRFNLRIARDGVTCAAAALGDPLRGVAKRCSVQVVS